MSSKTHPLSDGALKRIVNNDVQCEILQVIDIQEVNKDQHYIVWLSDGTFHMPFELCALEAINNLKSLKSDVINSLIKVKTIVKKYDSIYLTDLEVFKNGIEVGRRFDLSPGNTFVPRRAEFLNKEFKQIAALNDDLLRWAIKGNVSFKSIVKPVSTENGQYFVFDLIDDSAEIRCIVYSKYVDITHYENLIQMGKMFYITQGKIEKLQDEFKVPNHNYRIEILPHTVIEDCSPAELKFDFVPISKIPEYGYETPIDVIGICLNVSEPIPLGADLVKKELILTDNLQNTVMHTIWQEDIEQYIPECPFVVALKGTRLKQYDQGNKESLNKGRLFINPAIKEAVDLQNICIKNLRSFIHKLQKE